MKGFIKKFFILILIFAFFLPVFAQDNNSSNSFQHYIFRVKKCQISRYGAKVQYFSYTGYVKTLYIPTSYVNKVFFIKIDQNAPYVYLHAILQDGKVWRLIVYLPNIMVNEYSTLDFSKADIDKINSVTELELYF